MSTETPRYRWMSSLASALLRCVDSPSSPGAAALLVRASRAQHAIARLPGSVPKGTAHCLQGWFHLTEGNTDEALRSFHIASEHFRGLLISWVGGLKYTIGALEGGERGRQACEEVREQVRADGWSDVTLGLQARMPGRLELLHR